MKNLYSIAISLSLLLAMSALAIVFDGTPVDVEVIENKRTGKIEVRLARKLIFTNTTEAAKHCYRLYERTEDTEKPISNSVNITFRAKLENEAIEEICDEFVRCFVYPIEVTIIRGGNTIKHQYSPGFLKEDKVQQEPEKVRETSSRPSG